MKKLLLSFVFTSLCLCAYSQELKDTPDKKSTTIVVILDSLDAASAYRKCANVLQDQGWLLDNTDAVLMSIVTDWKKMRGFWVRDWQVNASVRELNGKAMVYLKAKTRQYTKANYQSVGIPVAEDYTVLPIEKRSNMGKDWEDLEKVASLIGSNFKYL